MPNRICIEHGNVACEVVEQNVSQSDQTEKQFLSTSLMSRACVRLPTLGKKNCLPKRQALMSKSAYKPFITHSKHLLLYRRHVFPLARVGVQGPTRFFRIFLARGQHDYLDLRFGVLSEPRPKQQKKNQDFTKLAPHIWAPWPMSVAT